LSSFPTEIEMGRVHDAVARLLGREPRVENPEMLRAILLGIRLSRRRDEARRGRYERAAALFLEIVRGAPFGVVNTATALAGALLYLERHGARIRLGEGHAAQIVNGVRDGTMDEARLASLLRLRSGERTPSRPIESAV
jgi:prophage maintenance system killer protein